MSITLNYLVDHDMNIRVADGKMDLLSAETELRNRLKDNLEIIHIYKEHYDKGVFPDRILNLPWTLEINHHNNSCELRTPIDMDINVYPKAMELCCFSEDLYVGPYSWFRFVESYFEQRDQETRKQARNTILKIRRLLNDFHPKVFVAQGDNFGFDHIYDEIEEGASIEQALRPGGSYEKYMINEWNCWPGGFRLMGEKDTDAIPADYDKCIIFYQKIEELLQQDFSQKNLFLKEGKEDASGYMIDDRDGECYKTVKIGNQIWMAENLRFKPLDFPKGSLPRSISVAEEIRSIKGELCECEFRLLEVNLRENKPWEYRRLKSRIKDIKKILEAVESGENLGRLYTWFSANDLDEGCLDDEGQVIPELFNQLTSTPWQGIAPKGWRMPTTDDFRELFEYCSSHSSSKTAVSLKSLSGWCADKKLGSGGTDEFGFDARPSGFANVNSNVVETNYDIGWDAFYWTCSPQETPKEEYLQPCAYYWRILHRVPNPYPIRDVYIEDLFNEDYVSRDTFMAVRCIKRT